MTPEEAQRYVDSPITKGPWEALHEQWEDPDGTLCERFSVIAGGDAILETIDFDPDYHDPRANTAIAAVASDMAATIAAQTWEYNNQYRPPGETRWRKQKWEPTPGEARSHRAYYWMTDPKDIEYRLVRRPVGPLEVIEP